MIDELAAQAKTLPRLRMNLISRQSLDEKCYRFLNAMDSGVVVAVTTYDNGGAVIERVHTAIVVGFSG